MLQLELSKYLLVRGQYVFEFKQDHILMTPKLKKHNVALLCVVEQRPSGSRRRTGCRFDRPNSSSSVKRSSRFSVRRKKKPCKAILMLFILPTPSVFFFLSRRCLVSVTSPLSYGINVRLSHGLIGE